MFQSCYRNDIWTVGIVGPSGGIISSLNSQEIYTVTLIDNASRGELQNPLDDPASRYKLQTFLVSISTVTELEKNLRYLKTSKWWNHMASFLIIDTPKPRDQACSKAFQVLSTAWKMNLLHAKFICHHRSNGTLIYSYNPYTEKAPLPWQLEKTYKKDDAHPWTLLVRSYQGNQEICENLEFDQTQDLGGYKIRAEVLSSSIKKNSSRINLESIIGSNAIMARYIFRVLNSTSKFIANSPGKLFSKTTSGITDITLEGWYLQNNFNTSMTYPHRPSGIAAINQHRGNRTQIGKLLRVIDYSSRYAVVVVCFVAFAFFKFFLRQSVMTATLTIVRLICNAAVPNIPNNVAARIFLSALFMFLVTMQAIYQGQLASLLTKSEPLPNVETVKDLENFEYTVYGYKGYSVYLKKMNFSGSYVPLEAFDCTEYVLRDDTAVCVRDGTKLVNIANKYDLHLSDTLVPGLFVYFVREDWPVEERWNAITSRLFQGNIIEHIFMEDSKLRWWKEKLAKKDKQNQSFTVIALEELVFAFAILGIGLAIATVVFIIEVWTGRR